MVNQEPSIGIPLPSQPAPVSQDDATAIPGVSTQGGNAASPAGWFSDGTDPRLRYWDGTRWTDHFHEVAAPEPKAKRLVPVPALVWGGVGALVLGILLGSAVAGAGNNSVALKSQLSDAKGKISALQGSVDAAAAEKTVQDGRSAELDARSTALDAREAAIKGQEDTVAANTFAGDGVYVVGKDVQPGQYKSAGGSNCYWARLNAAGDDIIDNDLGSGPAVVTVQPSDGLLKVSGCAPFTKAG